MGILSVRCIPWHLGRHLEHEDGLGPVLTVVGELPFPCYMVSHTNYSAEKKDARPAMKRAAICCPEQIAHLKAISNHAGSYMRTTFFPGKPVHSHGSDASVAAGN